MRVFLKKNVFEEALDRIRWLFDEFDNIVVSVSGGKDSTIVLELALIVAREKARLPLSVMFIDQEAEWQSTVDMITDIMERPEVDPYWYQLPIILSNATSQTDKWLKCWDPEAKDRWMHPMWDRAITENIYGTDRFKTMFNQISRVDYKDQRVCYLVGIRAEESPNRRTMLTQFVAYKGETWGKRGIIRPKDENHVVMQPIYDWSFSDVWTAIYKNNWKYSRLYDSMYQYGVPSRNMRVSNVHHETAVGALWLLQEIEPQTYERLTQRISGIDMAGKMQGTDFFPKKLPYMFKDWKEYRDYLLEKLILDPAWKVAFRKQFADLEWAESAFSDRIHKVAVTAILTNDYEGTKMENLKGAPKFVSLRKKYQRAGIPHNQKEFLNAGRSPD